MKGRLLGLLVILSLLLAGIPATAAPPTASGGPSAAAIPDDLAHEVTLTAVEDTWINGWQPMANYGVRNEFYVRSGNVHAALLKFDVSGIPSGATILQARLTLYPVDTAWLVSHPFTLSAYQVLRAWGETEATWLNATAGDMWGLPGANDAATDRSADAATSVTLLGTEAEANLDVTAVVADWVSGTAVNNGLFLGGSATKAMARAFASSSYWDPTMRPKLYVLYTTYPVADKGVMDFQASADTWISEWARTANYEGRDRIKVRTGGEFESLVKFDLGSGMLAEALPEGAVVAKATLKLYNLTEFTPPGDGFPPDDWDGLGVAAVLAPKSKPLNRAPSAIGAADAPYCSPDMYEPDDTMEQAKWFTVDGLPQTHGFHECTESDWVKFEATAGTRYMIQTLRLGAWYDTMLFLYDAAGTELAFDDDSGPGLASSIVWTAPADGVYYVKVVEYPSDCDPLGPWFDCSSGSYDLVIRSLGLRVYKALKNWTANEATWEQASAGEAWEIAGALGDTDREAPPLDSVPLPVYVGWVELDVTEAVRDWTMDMTAAEDNFGFVVQAADDVSREYTFASMEYSDATKRPVLEVVYVTKPADILLNVVATNDFHGALVGRTYSWSRGNVVGGLAWIAGYYNVLRALNPGGVIPLDAGDMMQGTLESNYFFGESTIAGFNALGLMGATFGNHEFDWGLDKLADRIAQSNFPWVSANIRLKATGERPDWAVPYTYIEAKGIKIGLIGVALPGTGAITNPAFTGHLDFTDPATEINAIVDEVWAGGANMVIVIAHVGGFAPDFGDAAALANALDPDKVNLLVTGHTHSQIATTINGIPVIQSYNGGSAFGRVDFAVDPWFKTVTSFTVKPTQNVYNTWNGGPATYEGQTVARDEAVAAALQPYLDAVQELKNTVIGEAAVPLVRNYRYESNMGNFVTDAMRAYDDTIDFAMTNSGGLRADIDAGPITYGELFSVLPFGNTFVKVWLTGEQVRATLEDGITGQHGIVQVSGLQFTFDYDLPAHSRIIGDVIDARTGEPLDPARTYIVLVNSFMAGGGDHYGTLPLAPQENTYTVDIEYMAEYVRTHSPISAAVEGRITALGTPPSY